MTRTIATPPPQRPNDTITRARVAALFASDVQPADAVTADAVRAAIRAAVRTRGCAGCAQAVAYEYGQHPEDAQRRTQWAILTVRAVYPARGIR